MGGWFRVITGHHAEGYQGICPNCSPDGGAVLYKHRFGPGMMGYKCICGQEIKDPYDAGQVTPILHRQGSRFYSRNDLLALNTPGSTKFEIAKPPAGYDKNGLRVDGAKRQSQLEEEQQNEELYQLYSSMTVTELRDHAADNEISLEGCKNKAEIIQTIIEAETSE